MLFQPLTSLTIREEAGDIPIIRTGEAMMGRTTDTEQSTAVSAYKHIHRYIHTAQKVLKAQDTEKAFVSHSFPYG